MPPLLIDDFREWIRLNHHNGKHSFHEHQLNKERLESELKAVVKQINDGQTIEKLRQDSTYFSNEIESVSKDCQSNINDLTACLIEQIDQCIDNLHKSIDRELYTLMDMSGKGAMVENFERFIEKEAIETRKNSIFEKAHNFSTELDEISQSGLEMNTLELRLETLLKKHQECKDEMKLQFHIPDETMASIQEEPELIIKYYSVLNTEIESQLTGNITDDTSRK